MTGFFRSLATGAIGSGPRIRPAASPYETPDLIDRPLSDAATMSLKRGTEHDAPTDVQHEKAVTLHERKVESVATKAAEVVTQRSASVRSSARPSRDQRPFPHASDRDPAVEPAGDRDERQAVALAISPGPNTPEPRLPAESRRPYAPGRSGYEPIQAAPSPTSERRTPEAVAVANGAQPDVHIHIGRIELTALAAAAPPRRQAPTVKTGMALDEYLQRRNRKSR